MSSRSGKERNVSHSDRRIANVPRQLQELPGQQLFKYVCDEGGCRQISSQDVNAYLREVSGDDFSSRQFRTWGATCMAVSELAPLTAEASDRAFKRQINAAVDVVAAKLVNTRSVCRSSYNIRQSSKIFEPVNWPTSCACAVRRARGWSGGWMMRRLGSCGGSRSVR